MKPKLPPQQYKGIKPTISPKTSTVESQRVKITKTTYNRKAEIVIFDILLKDGREASMIFHRGEIGPTFGFTLPLEPENVQELCDKMLGKEINVEVGGDE